MVHVNPSLAKKKDSVKIPKQRTERKSVAVTVSEIILKALPSMKQLSQMSAPKSEKNDQPKVKLKMTAKAEKAKEKAKKEKKIKKAIVAITSAEQDMTMIPEKLSNKSIKGKKTEKSATIEKSLTKESIEKIAKMEKPLTKKSIEKDAKMKKSITKESIEKGVKIEKSITKESIQKDAKREKSLTKKSFEKGAVIDKSLTKESIQKNAKIEKSLTKKSVEKGVKIDKSLTKESIERGAKIKKSLTKESIGKPPSEKLKTKPKIKKETVPKPVRATVQKSTFQKAKKDIKPGSGRRRSSNRQRLSQYIERESSTQPQKTSKFAISISKSLLATPSSSVLRKATSEIKQYSIDMISFNVQEENDEENEEEIEDKSYQSFSDRSRMLLSAKFQIDSRHDMDTQSESSITSASEREMKDLDMDFLENFQYVPSMSDLSLRFSSDEIIAVATPQQSEFESLIDLDKGRFVDPLTGAELTSTTTISEFEEEYSIEEEAEEEEEEDDESQDIEIDFDIVDDAQDYAMKTVIEDIDHFQEFVRFEKSKFGSMFTEKIETPKSQQARLISQLTLDILFEIAGDVVTACETYDHQKVLRQNLNKDKLLEELDILITEYKFEKQKNDILNRKVTDFFKRKKIMRNILPEPPELLATNKDKYFTAICEFDNILRNELLQKQKYANTIAAVRNDYEEKQKSVAELENNLDTLIETTILNSAYPNVETFINHQLALMRIKRNEISEVRLKLIQRQDTLAKLRAKICKLEDIGDGLNMQKFEHLQTETQALDKKIEDKNADLKKLHNNCNSNLHVLTHMREKQKILQQHICQLEIKLEQLQTVRKNHRKYLLNLKLQRTKLREEMRNLSFQGGLLDKPALMFDYDSTVDTVSKRKIRIVQMKSEISYLLSRIATLENRREVSIASTLFPEEYE